MTLIELGLNIFAAKQVLGLLVLVLVPALVLLSGLLRLAENFCAWVTKYEHKAKAERYESSCRDYLEAGKRESKKLESWRVKP